MGFRVHASGLWDLKLQVKVQGWRLRFKGLRPMVSLG